MRVPVGSPCWVELATPDPDQSMRFFHALFEWQYQRVQDADGQDYLVALLEDEPVAGLRPHRQAVLDWTVYLAVRDITATGERVHQLGGSVLRTRELELPGVGTTALIEDPSGATVGLVRPSTDWGFTAGIANSFVWLEFVTRQATEADRFFGSLFGYTQTQFGDGRRMDYVVYSVETSNVLGRVRMDSGAPTDVPPRWIAHFLVTPGRFDETLYRARRMGARLRFQPYTSSLGRVAVLSDPVGTRFALIDASLASEWDYGSAADDPTD